MMLGKASQLEPNITGFLSDFKRARYENLAFVDIYLFIIPHYHMIDVLSLTASPLEGDICPVSILKDVVFPAPLIPSRPKHSPIKMFLFVF